MPPKEKSESDKLYETAKGLIRKDDVNGAIAFYTKALEMKPDNRAYLYERALAYIKIKDYTSAEKDLDKIHENVRGLICKAKLYVELGNNAKAVEKLKKVLLINPDHIDATTMMEDITGVHTDWYLDQKLMLPIAEKPRMNFNSVVGLTELKEDLTKSFVYPLIKPELAKAFGIKGGGGYILY